MSQPSVLPTPSGSVLVVGGGISGLSAALEAAEAGLEAHIVEQRSFLGGRVAQLHKYFPKLCPPVCGLEINFRRLRTNRNVHVHTQSRITRLSGKPGDFVATIEQLPRFINDRCTSCNACVEACPAERKQRLRLRPQQHQSRLPSPPHGLPPALCRGPRHVQTRLQQVR